MKHIFILNGSIENHPFSTVIEEVMKDYDHSIIYTSDKDDAINIGKQFINDHDRIYAVGGDGMVNQVIQNLVHTDNELVIIPYGTANDFHRFLSDVKDSRKVLTDSLSKEARKIDVGLLNDRYYINSCCFGLDSVIANKVHEGINIPILKNQSYLISIVKQVFGYKSRYVKLYDEDHIYYQGEMTLCAINNGKYYGGGFSVTPDASINDHLLDIGVIDGLPLIKIPYMMLLLVLNKFKTRKEAHSFRCDHLYVDCQFSCNIDGEEVKYEHYEIKMIPEAINLVY